MISSPVEEATWRLRSRAIWIEKGDKNTRFFHRFASQRCSQNTIWDLTDEEGNLISTDSELKNMAFNHFKAQYRAFDSENIDTQLDVLKNVPRFFNEDDNVDIGKPVSITELKETINIMPKEKSPGPDGWTHELFHNFFEILGEDLLNAVEESCITGYIPGALNATFYTLIPKISKPVNFNDFRPIALCNFAYKVISKIIASRIKDKLAKCISIEQFGFLKDRLIFDVVGITQECLHTTKLKKLNSVILKMDLKKAYDNVSWQFLRLLLDQIGLNWCVAQWIMSCITTVNTVVLVNGAPTDFFKCHRGLRQGCPLSPLLFLLVVEVFSRMMTQVVASGSFQGLKVAVNTFISHILFVDDVLILGAGKFEYWMTLKSILSKFCDATGMAINCHKSVFLVQNVDQTFKQSLTSVFNIKIENLDQGMKYLGFFLKPNNYRVNDWLWLLQKIEKRIGNWTFRWLSLGGRLTLANSVLQSIPVYWLSLVKLPTSVIHRIQLMLTKFIWKGGKKCTGFHLTKWKNIAKPKLFGGWGIKHLSWFAQSLAAKSCWRGLFGTGLWKLCYAKNISRA
jgi:hypothetical protein